MDAPISLQAQRRSRTFLSRWVVKADSFQPECGSRRLGQNLDIGSGQPGSRHQPGTKTSITVHLFRGLALCLKSASFYSGMLPCFLRGMVSTLVSSIRSARISRARVSCGSITSSI